MFIAQNLYQEQDFETSATMLSRDVTIDFFCFCGIILTLLKQKLLSDSKMESHKKPITTDIYIEAAARPIASSPSFSEWIICSIHSAFNGWSGRRAGGYRERKKLNEEPNYYPLFGEAKQNCANRRQRISSTFYRIGGKPAYCW